ncbi:Cell division cycle-associated 7-like protein [Gryllus bimaculatus]|nr:Cell division cycle-associated 7-like protein [Gryllus bimaculatus]
MSDSESDNEYAALVKKNLERKQALLAELGLDNLLNEGRQLFAEIGDRDKRRQPAEIRDRSKPRQSARRKSVFEEKPARRSVRIQKKSNTVKYVKGFRGFCDSDGQESLDDDRQSDVESIDALNRRGPNSKDHENCQANHKARENESKDQENKNVSGFYVREMVTDQNASLDIVENNNKAVLVQKKIETDEGDNQNKNNCESVVAGPGVCEASGVRNSDPSFKNKDHALHEEKLVETVQKNYILNNNNNDLLEYVEGHQGIEWNDRSEEICKQIILKHVRRSVQLKKHDDDTDSEDDWSKYKNVMFCISASEDSDDSDDVDDSNGKIPRTRRRMSHPKFCYDVPVVSCEEVTEEMLANIAKRSSCKVYDQLNGTTCHQCRQKTFDTKTVCRSGRCVGVRGMFCGICLPKRYGEQVADALKNPDWECPVCRGICNCSFCRARAGKIPTGILYPEARQQGYNCVAEYLKDKDDKENISTKEKKLKILKC